MAKPQLSKQIEECLIASAWVKPESRLIDTPEIYKIINTSAPYGFLNGIYRTSLDSKNVEAAVASHFASFKNSGISFRWYSFPHSKPEGLAKFLETCRPSSVSEMHGLYIEGQDYFTAATPHVSVEELSDQNIDEYAEANNEERASTEASWHTV